jgi:hypothetical protein
MLLGLAMTVASGARAQRACEACVTGQPQENTIAAWLQSGDPRLEAWGAAFALKSRDRALIPEMIGVARDWRPLPVQVWKDGVSSEPRTQDQLDRQAAMSAVLDALVEMRATLELDVLRDVARDFPSQTIVLAARMPPGEVQPLLMEWFELPEGVDDRYFNEHLQRAAAAMLANHPAPGFVAELMRGTHVRMTLAVSSPNGGLGMGIAGDCGVGGIGAIRADWPEVHTYAVRETTGKDDPAEILIPGTDAIRLVRTTEPPRSCPFGLFLDDKKRGRLIAQLLGIAPKDLAWGQRGTIHIVYESDHQVETELRVAIDAEEEAMIETEKSFENRGLIPSTESEQALPQLDVWVWDQRSDHPAALPLPSLPYANVHWNDGKDTWGFLQSWDSR